MPADDIRMRAYLRWEAAGRPSGDGVRFWLEAEQELRQAKVTGQTPAPQARKSR